MYRKIDHPFVSPQSDEFVAGTRYCIMNEFSPAGDLEKLVHGHRAMEESLSEGEVLRYFTMLCMGVHHVFKHKIVLKDLKPSNIWVALFQGGTK